MKIFGIASVELTEEDRELIRLIDGTNPRSVALSVEVAQRFAPASAPAEWCTSLELRFRGMLHSASGTSREWRKDRTRILQQAWQFIRERTAN